MTINEKIKELEIYLEKVFKSGVNTEEDRKLVIRRFEKDLDILEINKMIENHNKFISFIG
jgi:hypothetical protein